MILYNFYVTLIKANVFGIIQIEINTGRASFLTGYTVLQYLMVLYCRSKPRNVSLKGHSRENVCDITL
jgi:hypothetical protein